MEMASKVRNLLKVIGRHTEVGQTMPHAMDGVRDGGMVNAGKAYRIRQALHKQRLRASGMSDSIFGSKEVGGSMDNDFEQVPKK